MTQRRDRHVGESMSVNEGKLVYKSLVEWFIAKFIEFHSAAYFKQSTITFDMAKLFVATVLVLGIGAGIAHGQFSNLFGQSPPQYGGGQMPYGFGAQQPGVFGALHNMLSGAMSGAMSGGRYGAQNGLSGLMGMNGQPGPDFMQHMQRQFQQQMGQMGQMGPMGPMGQMGQQMFGGPNPYDQYNQMNPSNGQFGQMSQQPGQMINRMMQEGQQQGQSALGNLARQMTNGVQQIAKTVTSAVMPAAPNNN